MDIGNTIELYRLVNTEFQKTKYLIESIEQSLSNLEKITGEEILSDDFYSTMTAALEQLHFELYNFNNSLTIQNNWFNPLKICEFLTRQPNLSEYYENYQSTCIIVNSAIDFDMMHIYDIKNTEKYNNFFSTLYTNFKNNLYERTTVLPAISKEIFGIVINNCFFRVELKRFVESDKFLGCLIDHGRIVKLSVKNNFYLLPPVIQNEPSMAICCKVINNNESKRDFFENFMQKKFTFVVKRIYNSLIEIYLQNISNPFLHEFNEVEEKWFNFNCFENNNRDFNIVNQSVESAIDLTYDVISNQELFFNKITHNLNIENSLHVPTPPVKNYFSFTNNSDIIQKNSFNLDYCTENLFKFRDNEAISFYQDKKECSPQTLRNLELENDKSIDIHNKRKIPLVGSSIYVVPTHLVNVSTFYGQIINDESGLCLLAQLQSNINDRAQVSKHRKFTSDFLPQKWNLVLAKFTDGSFYRAQVMQSNFDEFKVFYLDYGNECDLHYSDLRVLDEKFLNLDFQAIKFELEGIKTKIHPKNNEDLAVEAENFLTQNFLNKKFFAKIVSTKNDTVIVTILSPNFKCSNNNLSDVLVIKDFAIYNPNN